MTVFEMFTVKYREWLKRMTKREWERIKESAEAKKMSIPDYMMFCIEITENDCNPRKNMDTYWELIKLNGEKLIASNRHRQEHGHIDRYWLTKKGLKEYNKIVNS